MTEKGIRTHILREIKGGFKIGRLRYETDGKNVWVLELRVQPEWRRKGVATRLLTRLMERVNKTGGYFNPGAFVDDGVHLKKTIRRLAVQFPNMKLGADFERDSQ